MKDSFIKWKKWIIIGLLSTILVISLILICYYVGLPIYHYNRGMAAFQNDELNLAIEEFNLSKDIKDANKKIYEVAVQAVEEKDYAVAEEGFSFVQSENMENPDYPNYAIAMNRYQEKDYSQAITYFIKTNDFKDSATMLVDSYYENGETLLSKNDYRSALENFEKIPEYKDANEQIQNCHWEIAEDYWKSGRTDAARAGYELLPNDFGHGDFTVANRLNSLNVYEAAKALAGEYKVTKGDYKVTQVGSYGYSHWWYKTSIGYGYLRVDVKLNLDGSVTVSGTATGTRFTTYSSISAGVNSGTYSAPFSKTFTSGGLPVGVLYNENYTTLKYLGNKKFSLTYNQKDNSQDVYFTYKYTSDYVFEKKD